MKHDTNFISPVDRNLQTSLALRPKLSLLFLSDMGILEVPRNVSTGTTRTRASRSQRVRPINEGW